MARLALRRNERLFSRGQRQMRDDPAAAVETLRQSCHAAPRDAQARLFLAMALADAAKPEEALAVLQEALVLEPGNAVLLAEVGVVHLDEQRPGEALAAFDRIADTVAVAEFSTGSTSPSTLAAALANRRSIAPNTSATLSARPSLA